MDKNFTFLTDEQAQHLNDILNRRNPAFFNRIQQADSISRSDASEIISIIANELTENLDKDWEPTEYGRTVNGILAQFNTARIVKWPG